MGEGRADVPEVTLAVPYATHPCHIPGTLNASPLNFRVSAACRRFVPDAPADGPGGSFGEFRYARKAFRERCGRNRPAIAGKPCWRKPCWRKRCAAPVRRTVACRFLLCRDLRVGLCPCPAICAFRGAGKRGRARG